MSRISGIWKKLLLIRTAFATQYQFLKGLSLIDGKFDAVLLPDIMINDPSIVSENMSLNFLKTIGTGDQAEDVIAGSGSVS